MSAAKPMLSTALLRTQSDARLVSLAQAGNEVAFTVLVARYRGALHRYCRRLLLRDAHAEDVVQQTFLAAWTALGDGDEIVHLKPWLYRVAHNTAINALKKSGYDYSELNEFLVSPVTTEDDLERRTVVRETLAGVAALPDRQREALLGTAIEGRTHADLAQEFRVSEGAVHQLVFRARETLRKGATAVLPLPLASWAAAAATPGPPMAERVGTIVTGGSAGAAATLAKATAVVVTAGAVAVGPGGGTKGQPPPAHAKGSAAPTLAAPNLGGDADPGPVKRDDRDDAGESGGGEDSGEGHGGGEREESGEREDAERSGSNGDDRNEQHREGAGETHESDGEDAAEPEEEHEPEGSEDGGGGEHEPS